MVRGTLGPDNFPVGATFVPIVGLHLLRLSYSRVRQRSQMVENLPRIT